MNNKLKSIAHYGIDKNYMSCHHNRSTNRNFNQANIGGLYAYN